LEKMDGFKVKVKNTLFNLGMVTYSYERQDIIQFALKRLCERLHGNKRTEHGDDD
jgi:hypothetical protein